MWQRLGELWMVGEVDVIQCQPGWQAPWRGAGDTMLRSGVLSLDLCRAARVGSSVLYCIHDLRPLCLSALCTLGTWPPEPFLTIFDFVQHQRFSASVH